MCSCTTNLFSTSSRRTPSVLARGRTIGSTNSIKDIPGSGMPYSLNDSGFPLFPLGQQSAAWRTESTQSSVRWVNQPSQEILLVPFRCTQKIEDTEMHSLLMLRESVDKSFVYKIFSQSRLNPKMLPNSFSNAVTTALSSERVQGVFVRACCSIARR